VAPRDHLLHRFRRALERGFDSAVGKVAYPTGDAQAFRLAPARVTEPHVLHPSRDLDAPPTQTWQASQ